MKRLITALLVLLALAGCGRRGPGPDSSPSPTVLQTVAPVPSFTPTPSGSPVPRITIVPSATRLATLAPTQAEATATPEPTGTVPAPPTPLPSATPTQLAIEASPTPTGVATPTGDAPTPTLPDSPLPPPDQAPTGDDAAAQPTATADVPSPTAEQIETTPSPTVEQTPTPTEVTEPTASATSEPTAVGESLAIAGLTSSYDADFQELYLWGEVVNTGESHQRLTELMPVVYDAAGAPVTSSGDVDYPWDFDELRASVVLKPEQALAFSFVVYLPPDFAYEDEGDYEILAEGEPAEAGREDLDIVQDDFDDGNWPDSFYVEGVYENPGEDLSEYVAVVVTLYDEVDAVVGVGWMYETDPVYLGPGQHAFEVDIQMWTFLEDVQVYRYKVQAFGR